MFPSYGLYVCIILELLILGLLLEYFATLPKILHLKKIATNYSIFLHQLYFFSYGKVKDVFWGDRDQISSKEGKRRGKGGMGEEPKMTGFYCKIPIIKQGTNFTSQTVGQTYF